jgi:VanZ family protein
VAETARGGGAPGGAPAGSQAEAPTRADGVLGVLRALGAQLQRLPRWAGIPLAALWGGFIWELSSRPGASEPPNPWKVWLFNSAHAPLFGLVAFWLLVAFPREEGWPRVGKRLALVAWGTALAYAVVDELHQSTTPGRDASALDVLTDAVGAACTLWMAAYVGSPQASPRGTLARLGVGLGLCGLAGLLSTLAT